MAPPNSPKKISGDSLSSWQALIMFRLGYLQRTCDLILATVTARPTEPAPTEMPQTVWSRLKEAATVASLIHKLMQIWKAGPWSILGWLAFFAGKWFGVL